MSGNTLISDDLLRQLVGVGQVDLVVGIPTLNHASTIGDMVKAVQTCFLRHFPRQRTVLIHSDGGSTDATVAIVRDRGVTDADTVTTSHGLRTTHRISTPYRPMPGQGDASRLVLRAADLLQARVVVMLDPDLSVTPERVAALARPVGEHELDFVTPVYDRPPADGLLVTQLLRPLFGSLFGRRLHEPSASEFACSGRFAAAWGEDSTETADAAADGGTVWLTAAALSGPFKTGQVVLGRRTAAAGRPQPPLAAVFPQIVGDALLALAAYAGRWTTAAGEAVLTLGAHRQSAEPDSAGRSADDGTSLLASFADDVRNLEDILRAVIGPDSLAAIVAAANEPAPHYPGPLWAATVADFLVAYQRGVMRRDHLVQALLPLYRARAGSFLCTYGAAPGDAVDTALEDLCVDFERIRNQVVERWTTTTQGR
ncbi:MAG: glycosyltransferase family 2 protein [Vicinamibacterales bacterium]